MIRSLRLQTSLALALFVLALALPAFGAEEATAADPWAEAAADAPTDRDDQRVVGRVVGLKGVVYAQTPGEPKRRLTEDSAIYPGDRLTTSRGAQLGVLSGDYYTALSEDTTLTYSKVRSEAPVVRLERGDVHVINAGEGEGATVRTPDIEVASAQQARVAAIPEKAWLVSLACALEGQVEVAGAGGQAMVVDQGGCAASKPIAGIYAAGDAPPVGAGAAPGEAMLAAAAAGAGAAAADVAAGPPVGPASTFFTSPVGDAPPGFQPYASRAIPSVDDSLALVQPCDSGGCARGIPANAAPVNPWQPGPPPPPPTPAPTNPWVGGQLPPPPTP